MNSNISETVRSEPAPVVAVTPARAHVPVQSAGNAGAWVVTGAILIAVALVVFYFLGVKSRHREEADLASQTASTVDAPPVVDIASVRRGSASEILTLPGEATAFNQTTLYARTNGYISKWLVDIGDSVKKGQTLATIETPELDDELLAARAKVAEAASEATLARTDATFAKVTYQRWAAALPEGVVSEQERDEKQAELQTSIAKVAAADAEVALDQADVHRLQTLVSFKDVTAPFSGVITQRFIDIGDLVTAGSTTSTTPLFTVAKFDKLRVFVNIPEAAIPRITPKMPAIARADEYPNRVFDGVVDRSAESLNPASRMMQVEVLVNNPGLLLKPGDYLRVSFETSRKNPPLQIPASALDMRPSGPEVAVVTKNNTVQLRPIVISQDMGSYIEVARGLKEGEKVALNVGDSINTGTLIDPHSIDSPVKTAAADATPKASHAE